MNIAEASAHHVVMEAHDDVRGATGVAHVTFDVDQAFIDYVLKTQQLCVENDFTQVCNRYAPTQWSDAAGNVISHPLSATELVISADAFWLRGSAPGGDVISEMIDIAGFVEEQQALKASVTETTPKRVSLVAYNDGPYARVLISNVDLDIDDAFIQDLLMLRQTCVEQHLQEVRKEYTAAQWRDTIDPVDARSLTGQSMIVTPSAFRLTASLGPDSAIRSESVDINAFVTGHRV